MATLKSLVAAILLSCLTQAATLSKRATVLIPKTVFDTTASLEQYFTYNYPWGGTTHKGGARMDKQHVSITSPGVLTITAQPVKGQAPAPHGGKQIAINYLSGAVGAKRHFTVPKKQRSRIHRLLPSDNDKRDMASLLAHCCERLAAGDRYGGVEG